jgi:hypothetical protein
MTNQQNTASPEALSPWLNFRATSAAQSTVKPNVPLSAARSTGTEASFAAYPGILKPRGWYGCVGSEGIVGIVVPV